MSFFNSLIKYFKSDKHNPEIDEIQSLLLNNKISDVEKRLSELKIKETDNNYIDYLYLQLQLMYSKSLFKECTIKSKELIELAERDEDNKILAGSLLIMAETYFKIGVLYKCFDAIEKIRENIDIFGDNELNRSLFNIEGAIHSSTGDLSNAIIAYNKGLEISKKDNNEKGIAIALNNIGTCYVNLGDIEKAKNNYKRSFDIKFKNNLYTSAAITQVNIAEVYIMEGEYEKAEEMLIDSLNTFIDEKIDPYIAHLYFNLIDLMLIVNKNNMAKNYLDRLKELHDKNQNPRIELYYEIGKAYILKNSDRIVNRAKSQELFHKIANQPMINFEITISAKLNLFDLLLIEFGENYSQEVYNEIIELLENIHDFAKNQNSYTLLIESYILRSKFSLLSFEIEEAKNLLTQAELMAEEKGLQKLAVKVANNFDEILSKQLFWEKLKDNNADIKERIKLLNFDGNIQSILKKQYNMIKIKPETPIMFLILSQAGIPIYSVKFREEDQMEENLVAGFITAFNAFSSEVFASKGSIERINHHEYTVLLRRMENITYCYVFKEHSYSANNKIKHFIELINEDDKSRIEEMIKSGSIDINYFDNYIKQIFDTDFYK